MTSTTLQTLTLVLCLNAVSSKLRTQKRFDMPQEGLVGVVRPLCSHGEPRDDKLTVSLHKHHY